jgi:protocatechuate 3,4-dioxygenase beta subunit
MLLMVPTVLGTTTTDALGNYIFTNLPAGDYRVGFSNLPSGFTFSSANQGTDDALDADADASTGGITGIIHLNEGEDNMTIDAGIHAAPGLASLGNYVWFDENQDGLQDATESGVPGVSVTLYNNAGTAIANTTTDANGFYQFTGLAPDAYSVGFSNLPDGYQYTDQDAGGAATNATSGDANDSDVNPGTGKTGQVTLIAGQNYPDLDAGIFTDKAALGNYVWNDDNRDGIQDANESGVAGVTVTLYDDGGTAVASTVTDANGYYYFPNLEPGDYTVGFSNLPNGSIVTTPDASGSTDANDSDVDPNTLMTPTVSLFAGDNNLTLDMGIYTPLSAGLGNYTWIDANKNGLQDANEAPLAGVTVTLYNASGTPIATAITNGDGYYTFPDLGPGTYSVGFSDLPSIYQDGNLVSTTYTTQNVTGAITNTNDPTDYTDSDVDGAGNTGSVTLTEGEYNPGLDAGISPNYQYGSIGNYVWNDDNGNGLQDEPTTNGINGLMVYLYSAGPDNTVGTSDDALIDSTLTANDGSSNPGYYMFDSLMSGGYYVNFPLFASGRQITTQTATNQTDGNSDADALTGNSPLVTINAYGSGSDRDNMTIDAGYVPAALADLGNYVWNDINKDGIQDPTEVGVAGITITLYDNANNIVSSTVTDAYGKYLFEDLQPGIYKVGFTLPSNYVFTTQDAVGTDSTDSDVDVLTGMSGTYTLMAGDSNMTVDAGIYFTQPNTASVGNYVWYDNNQNGIQDPGETGISGVTVTLYNASGVPVGTTVTDANGFYLFSDVTPGTYSVGFTPPVGLGFSPNNGGVFDPSNSDANPLNGMTSTFTVNAGDEITTVDAGLYQLPSSTASLGDKVWYDTNQDGIQDADEVGVAGVTVTLYDGTGTNVIATTTTNAFGNYIFNNLTPGDYIVGFSNIPSGYVLTNNTGTDSTTNSDANPGTGNTPVIHLSAGQHNMTYDAGIYSSDPNLTNSIGNYVWNDINKDGIQDGTEQGVAGVTATLYDATNNAIATAVTDENGYYLFPNLPNGTYYVGFSNTPVGFSYTTSNASGSTDANDSDVDPTTGYTATTTLTGNTHDMTLDAGIFIGSDRLGKGTLGDKVWYDLNNDGLQDPNEGGVQGVTVTLYEADGTTVIATTTTDALGNYIFTNLDAGTFVVGFSNLPAGFTITGQNTDAQGVNGESNSDADPTTGKTTTIALAQGEDKMSVDMGIVPPANTASLGNYVWIDLNNNGLQDANEPGVPGVTVTLYDNAGNVLDVTTTDANGMYQYVGLTPGTYGVGFSNLPNGYSFTTQDADASGINGATNSDANTTTGLTATVTLAGGDNNPNLDAGIVSTTVASVGDYVWHDLDGDGEQDANEPGVGGVLVTLYDNTGNPVASTITKPDGSYIFTNVTPGDYTMGFTNIPGGMIFTTQETDPNSNTGSNANPTTGRTTTFTVTAGTHNPTIDAGILAPNTAGLGNYVWFDMNKDGIQDANEPGIPGVLVTLYAADGTTVLATAVTDGNGFYTFTNLPAGSYIVGFNTPAVLYTPDGARVPVPTTSDATADANDSDADALTGKTTSYTLAVGEYNPTIDGGFYYQFATPVLWNNFELSSTQCDAQLTWTTIEDHTAYYSILRRQNGNFEEVAKVTATGNNSLPVSYEYTDANLTDGIFEYKIKAVNIDNTYSYSPTRSIKMNCTQAGGIQVYPNPIVDELHIDLTVSSDELIEVVLTDAVGKVVAKQQNDVKSGANTITVQTQHLAAGSYFVTVHANGTTQVSKISKK